MAEPVTRQPPRVGVAPKVLVALVHSSNGVRTFGLEPYGGRGRRSNHLLPVAERVWYPLSCEALMSSQSGVSQRATVVCT